MTLPRHTGMVNSAIMYGKLTPPCSPLRKVSIHFPLKDGAFSTILVKNMSGLEKMKTN